MQAVLTSLALDYVSLPAPAARHARSPMVASAPGYRPLAVANSRRGAHHR
jgi:hypothetical protein